MPASGSSSLAGPGLAQLVDLDPEALQQGLLERELHRRLVRRVHRRRQVRELVGHVEGDARHAARRQRLEDSRAEVGLLRVDGGLTARRHQVGRGGDGPISRVPAQAGAPDRVELGQRQLDVGADAGRVEGQDADGIGEADAVAGERQLLVGEGLAGRDGEGLVAERALLQGDGDGLGQRQVADLAIRVIHGRRGGDGRDDRLAADAGVPVQVRRHRRDGDVVQVLLGEEALLLASRRHRKGRGQPDAYYLPAHSLTPLERSIPPAPSPRRGEAREGATGLRWLPPAAERRPPSRAVP